jgi:hypothetical protein
MNSRAASVRPLLLLASSVAGCHGCRDDHPYVPYTIGSAASPGPASDAQAPVVAAVSATAAAARHVPFASEAATVAPAGLAQWSIDDVVLRAPAGWVFVSSVVRDFDGHGQKDAFAIIRAAEGNDPGELAYYRGRAQGGGLDEAVTFAPPVGLSPDPGCDPIDRLAFLAPRSVLAEIGASCPSRAPATPDRWVAVVAGEGAPRMVLAAMIADPPGAPTLSVEADAIDRDGDGVRDVALRIMLAGAAGAAGATGAAGAAEPPRAAAVFAWVDRPAGLGQDLSVAEASFAALAATASARASRAKEAAEVPAFAAQVRALWRAVCSDGGSPRVVGVAGIGPFACGAGRALEDVGLAESHAYATTGDPLRAALALDRAERAPASRTAARVADARRWIARETSVVSARSLRAIAAVPVVPGSREPAWGALAFEPSGDLLVRTRAGLVRVDPEAGDEVQAADATDWKPAVTSPDGALRWTDTYDPCDGIGLRATFARTSADDVREVALPVAPPLGSRCSGARGGSVRASPIAWGPAGLEAIIDGEIVSVSPDLTRASTLAAPLGQPATPGSPRSPDGGALVVATGAGILVRGARHTRLLRAPELEGAYGDQHDCVVSNDEVHVACVHTGGAWVGAWDVL